MREVHPIRAACRRLDAPNSVLNVQGNEVNVPLVRGECFRYGVNEEGLQPSPVTCLLYTSPSPRD
eukprot:1671775-Alexandrium_andersonii.AAC.1